MQKAVSTTVFLALLLVYCSASSIAQQKKTFNYTVGANPSLNVSNDSGDITIHVAPGHQINIEADSSAQASNVEAVQSGNRIEVHTRRSSNDNSGAVSYNIAVPADTKLSVHTGRGTVRIDGVHADVSADIEAGTVTVANVANGHVHVRTVGGPIVLKNITDGHVEVTSVSGTVEMSDVRGPFVSVNTTDGKISYRGDVGREGDYSLTNHGGDIDFSLPASASVRLTARSVKGSVENSFPFSGSNTPQSQPNALSGTSKDGSTSIQLRSFSGKIRVIKQ
jgi:DUF4097 and DUF4098 domain-containing protein YvlB